MNNTLIDNSTEQLSMLKVLNDCLSQDCFHTISIAAKKEYPQADTSWLEKEIDRLVYELYGLTEEEVKVVEGK